MNAVVSGRAGVAVLLEGGRISSLHADDLDQLVPRQLEEYHFLLGEGTDLEFFEGVELATVREQLENAVRREEALDLALLLLDGELPDTIRLQAVQDLAECLELPCVIDSVEAVLYAAPLPETADLTRALRLSQNQSRQVGPFLRRLQDRQPIIRVVCQAWEAIPEALFGSFQKRREVKTFFVRAGLFRDLVRRIMEDDSVNHVGSLTSESGFRQLFTQPGQFQPHELGKILDAWMPADGQSATHFFRGSLEKYETAWIQQPNYSPESVAKS